MSTLQQREMKMDFHIYHHIVYDPQTTAQLQDVQAKLGLIQVQQVKIMSALSDLTAQVAATTTVEAAAALAIQGISKQLADAIAAGDPVALAALSAELKTSSDALAAAIPAGTTPPVAA